jgi:hypothetical protein
VVPIAKERTPEAAGLKNAPGLSPLFVLGTAHSGTTILYRMLAHHPGLVWFSQFSLRGGEIPGRFRVPGAGILDRVLRSFPHRWEKGEPRLRRLVVPRPGETATIWNHLLGGGHAFASVEELDEPPAPNPVTGREQVDVQRVRRCLAGFSERFDDRRLLAKVPSAEGYRFLRPLRDACPGARFVHIVRDGRPVAFSLRSKFERRFDPHDALLAAGRHWVTMLQEVESEPGDVLELRYEDLCDDVPGAIRTVLEHAELEIESFPYDRCPRKLTQTNSRRLEAASAAEVTELSELQHDLLSRYDYPR